MLEETAILKAFQLMICIGRHIFAYLQLCSYLEWEGLDLCDAMQCIYGDSSLVQGYHTKPQILSEISKTTHCSHNFVKAQNAAREELHNPPSTT